MSAFFQKHKIKILSVIFLIAFILPIFALHGTALAGDPTGGSAEGASVNPTGEAVTASSTSSPGFFEDNFVIPLLSAVLRFVAVMLSVAETIFEWIVNPDTMKAVMTNSTVYTTWRAVRDVFNIVFIMVLLFSAFATIFQYSKYNYKNVLLNLVLMALLVNFSFPLARFIVDFSNIIMFGFLQSMGGDNSFMTIIKNSNLGGIITVPKPDAYFLISAIIFTFILSITLLTIAIMLVIRTVALTIYIIFSPLAFVGSVLPGTKLANAGSEWWTDFMKNCFSGPIIIFMLYIATVMMGAMATAGGQIEKIAKSQVGAVGEVGPVVSKLILDISTFSIPIIILWYGIIQAQKSGAAGAEVIGAGAKRIKSAGKWLAKNPALGSVGFISKQSGLTGGMKAKWKNIQDKSVFGKNRREAREASIASKGPFAVKGAKGSSMKKMAEEYKKDGISDDELKARAAKGDAAAAYRLADDKNIDQATYDAFLAGNKDPALHKAINSKVKQNRADIVANYNAKKAAQEKVDTMTPVDIANEKADAIGKGVPGANMWSDSQVKTYTLEKELRLKTMEEIGNLTAEKFSEQSWSDITKLEPGASYTPEQVRTIKAAVSNLYGMSGPARAEVAKRMSTNQKKAIIKAARAIGITPPPI